MYGRGAECPTSNVGPTLGGAMKLMKRAPAAVAAVVAVTLLGTGCGSSSNGGSGSGGGQTLGQEFPKIKAAALAAHSVRMTGSVLQDGKRISLDMALQKPSDAA